MEIVRNNQKEILDIKNPVIVMRNAFDGFFRRLEMAEERISKLENLIIKTSKTEKQREQRQNKQKQNKQTKT